MKGEVKNLIKYSIAFILLAILGFSCMILILSDMTKNFDFYKNAEHITANFDTIIEDDHNKEEVTVRFKYKVGEEYYSYDYKCSQSEAKTYDSVSTKSIFYNTEKPSEARANTKTIFSLVLLLVLLGVVGIYAVLMAAKHIHQIFINRNLLKNNNYVMADFYKIEKKKSFYNTNRGIENYVICKYKKDEKEYVFTSSVMYNDVGSSLKNKQIRVYVDENNYKNYMVDMEDILKKAKIQHEIEDI